MHLVAENIGTNEALPSGEPIELAFDRLLLPITVTRQSLVLVDEAAPAIAITFTIAYDPVARVVTLNPLAALVPTHSYALTLFSPTDPEDPSGLHAIDGATLDPNLTAFPRSITFPVSAASATPPAMCNGIVGPCIDYCTQAKRVFQNNCSAGTCHNAIAGKVPLGLALPPSKAEAVLSTAIGRLAVESTMGALAVPGPPSFHFGQDMPIIDVASTVDPTTGLPDGPSGTGDPGNSFLMYKVLMGYTPPMAQAMTIYSLTWPGGGPSGAVPALTPTERATLAGYIGGSEMPLPGQVSATPAQGLSIDELETLSLWIAQGAPLSDCTQ